MKVQDTAMGTSTNQKMQGDTVTKLRSLAHDLSNSIETVMQASYLLAQAKLEEPNKRWLDLIDQATQDAARINREIRDILRSIT
jgi:signal transduction histidine kinase